MKNTKLRQYIQIHYKPSSDGTTGNRVGIASPGNTRWQSRVEQMQKQLTLKSTMQDFCIDRNWSQGMNTECSDLIHDIQYWTDLKSVQSDIEKIIESMNMCQGMYIE